VFSPPLGPNFNGLAESAVRIWKKAFMCHFRKQSLRLDEFLTATALAEDIINGRPLDYSDGKLYTPNHFSTRGPPQECLPIIDPTCNEPPSEDSSSSSDSSSSNSSDDTSGSSSDSSSTSLSDCFEISDPREEVDPKQLSGRDL
jgi:hypothetical protein